MSKPTATTEKTFSSYDKAKADNYKQGRVGYHPKLYQTVLDHHAATGGQLGTILDVGCGPGFTALALAPHFSHTIGIDPSEGMISTARTSTTDPNIRFEVSTAEDLGSHLSPPIADASVDLITASTAAHWFNMSLFWPSAARVLKPGGSVAIWCSGEASLSPSVPNHVAIQAAMDEIRDRELQPFYVKGNLMARDLYRDLGLPWTVDPPVEAFDKNDFYRKEYGPDFGNSNEYVDMPTLTLNLDAMEKMWGTTSPAQRWRDAHPEAVGTDKDVVKMIRNEVERLLHEAGVEKGKETLSGSLKAVLMIFKKKP